MAAGRLIKSAMADFTFHHGGYSVPDLDAKIDWYGRVLGFTLEQQFFNPPARAKEAMTRKGRAGR